MTFEELNGTLLGNDLSYAFVYANSVTYGWFVPLMLLSFFIVCLLGSSIMQQRFTGRIKPEVACLVSSFLTLGFTVILAQKPDLVSAVWIFANIGITALSLLWVILSSD